MKVPSYLQILKVRLGVISAEKPILAIRTLVVWIGRWAWLISGAPRRFRTRRSSSRPGPAFDALREFNDPSRRFVSERQARDPRSRWGRRPRPE
jgi:hypothetical protein